MKRDQLLEYSEPLHEFIHVVKVIMVMGIVFSIVFYGLAFNSYFNHQLYEAVIFASIGFALFHFLRRYVISLTCYFFRRLDKNHDAIDFIEQSLAGKEQRAFFLLLDKALATIQK